MHSGVILGLGVAMGAVEVGPIVELGVRYSKAVDMDVVVVGSAAKGYIMYVYVVDEHSE